MANEGYKEGYKDRAQQPDAEVLRSIRRAVTSLHFGSVEIIIQNGEVTGLERREKRRFTADKAQA